MATVIVLVGCYYGYTASGGPVGGHGDREVDGAQHRPRPHHLHDGNLVFWGANPRAPIGG